MKITTVLLLFIVSITGCSGQEKVSAKKFDEIALTNKIDFIDPKFDQARFSCAFLLDYKGQTYAVTAKHLLKLIKTEDMKSVYLQNSVKSWSMFPLDKKGEVVVADKLLNENKIELLSEKATFDNDWLVFSIKQNNTKIKPLQVRTTALKPGEKLYVIGWTRRMEEGAQRVYEFEYYKTVGNRILLKEIIVPEQFGGLSGAPLVDEQGLVVGLVSNGTIDPDTNKKYFSPCGINELVSFLDSYKQN
ncbi:MAG: trypsin-like serine protease [Mucilaginibacter sp.]|uniref:trypsin-like serine protease n=1 Tax=Mucilaginibacter sp. TaxID=1882438 RepID=UPI0032642944